MAGDRPSHANSKENLDEADVLSGEAAWKSVSGLGVSFRGRRQLRDFKHRSQKEMVPLGGAENSKRRSSFG